MLFASLLLASMPPPPSLPVPASLPGPAPASLPTVVVPASLPVAVVPASLLETVVPASLPAVLPASGELLLLEHPTSKPPTQRVRIVLDTVILIPISLPDRTLALPLSTPYARPPNRLSATVNIV